MPRAIALNCSPDPFDVRVSFRCSQCADKLRVRPAPRQLGACPKFPKDMAKKAVAKIRALKDSHKGETCVLIANGPSLNKMRWDWQDNFNVVMGMNKIFLGLERYNISKMTHCARGCPARDTQAVAQLGAGSGPRGAGAQVDV